MTKTKFLIITTPLLTLLTFLTLLTLPTSAATPDELEAGDLIRGESYSAVYYYGEDGFRYVFPNDKTYFTWYDDFDDVVWLSDSDMSSIQIGGNVTYKPGVKMIKITSDPTVYAVAAGGILRGIDSEEVATDLYGSSWNTMIDDVPDGFFSNYSLGSDLEFASQFDPEVEVTDAVSINDDKMLQPYVTIEITEAGYSEPTITVDSGTTIRFVNMGDEKHSATEWERNWGSGTLYTDDHYSRVFTEIGTWSYYSTYDDQADISGAIIVE
jgi:plastocyanin